MTAIASRLFGGPIRSILTLWVALIMCLQGAAKANANPEPRSEPAETYDLFLHENPEVVSEIGLTTAQIEQIDARIYEMRRKAIDLKAKADLARLDFEQIRAQESVDEARLFELADTIRRLEQEMEQLRISMTLSQNKILTQEQRRKLLNVYRERHRHATAPSMPPPPATAAAREPQPKGPPPPPINWDVFLQWMRESHRPAAP